MPIAERPWVQTFVRAMLLVAVVAVLYAPAWHGTWLWDDGNHVPTYRPSLYTAQGLWSIWTDPGYVQQYYPLMFTTAWLAHRVWGADPTGYHLLTLMLHAANALLVVWLLRLLGLSAAWWAGLLFAVHPVEVESVAWISELKNTQSTFFYLLSLISLLKSSFLFSPTDLKSQTRRLLYALGFVFFMAALFSKTVACTMPVTALILFWWKRGRLEPRDVLRVAPHLFFGAVLGLCTAHWEKTLIGASGYAWSFSLPQRFLIAAHAFWFYIGKLLWPHPLMFMYPRWDPNHLWTLGLFGFIGVVLLVVFLMILRSHTGRGPLAAVAIFGVVVAPALGFENTYPMRYTFVADHYQYAASIAILTLVVVTVQRYLKPRMATAVFCALCIVCGGLSRSRAYVFQNPEALWKDTLSKNPNCRMAHDNLSFDYFHQGRKAEAISEEWAALRLPEVDDLNEDMVMGELHLQIDRTPTVALHFFNLAMEAQQRLLPSTTSTVMRLTIEVFLSRAYVKAERPVDARNSSLEALHLLSVLKGHPRYNLTPEIFAATDAEIRARLGDLAEADHHEDEALEWFKTAAQAEPHDEAIQLRWAALLIQDHHPRAAADLYHHVLDLDPHSWQAHDALGRWDEQEGRFDEAIAHDRQAIDFNPDLKATRDRLARLLLKLGRKQEALAEYQAEIQADHR